MTRFPTGRKGGGANHQRGIAFPTPAGRLYGFRRQRRYKKWRRRRRTSPVGTVSQPIGKPFNGQAKGLLWLTWRSYAGPPQYYIPPEGGSPEPVREASAGPGQNPWRPGPKARRRHQPSPAKAGVNLREYRKAPPRSRSRSRPRHRRLNPQAPKGLVHKALTSSLKKHRFLPVLFFYNPVSRISPLLWAAPSMTDNS